MRLKLTTRPNLMCPNTDWGVFVQFMKVGKVALSKSYWNPKGKFG